MSDEQASVKYGYCECGCGAKTRLAPKTRRECGWTKGEPQRFVHGHQFRVRRPDRYRVEDRGFKTPCWIWQLALSPSGYPRESMKGESRAHRNMWEKKNGSVPDGLHLDHLCRVRACVNPDHLEPVTPAENARRGDGAKLTPADVAEIRTALGQGVMHRVLAARYGVSRQAISGISQGRNWRE